MIEKYCDSVLPEPDDAEADDHLQKASETMISAYRAHMGDFKFHLGLQAVWEFVGAANRYIVQNEPWALAKDESRTPRLHTVLYNLGESLRVLALLLKPVMPQTAEKMMGGLGIDPASTMMQTLDQGGDWGLSNAGTSLSKVGNLFPRIDAEKQKDGSKNQPQKAKKAKAQAVKASEQISFDKFKDVDLFAVHDF